MCRFFFLKLDLSFLFSLGVQSSGIIENSDHRKRVRPWEGLVVNTLESCDIMTSLSWFCKANMALVCAVWSSIFSLYRERFCHSALS